MKTSTLLAIILGVSEALWTGGVVSAEEALPVAKIDRTTAVDFEKEILPFLRKNCLACHSDSEAKGDVVLETPKTIRDDHDEPIVIPGEAAESLLFKAASHAGKPFMPPEKNKVGANDLTPEELALLKLWIDQGARGEVSRAGVKVEWFPLPPGVHPVYAISLAPDGGSLVCSRANQIFVYDLDDGRVLDRLTDPDLAGGIYPKPGVAHLDHVQDLALAPGGELLASGGFRCVKLWGKAAQVKKSTVALGSADVTAFASSTDGRLSAVGTATGGLMITSPEASEPRRTLEGHTKAVTGLRFTLDGGTLLSASDDQTIGVWDVRSGRRLVRAETGTSLAGAVFVDGGVSIAAAGADCSVHVWRVDPAEGGLIATAGKPLVGHTQAVTCVDVVPTSPTQIVSAGADGQVIHWDTSSGKEIRRLGHGAPVTAVAVRPDGQRIASCGKDASLRLWNLADGSELASLRGDARARHRAGRGDEAAKLAAQMLEAATRRLAEAEGAVKKADDAAKKATEELSKADTTLGEKRQAAEAAEKEQAALKDESDKSKVEAAGKKVDAARKEVADAEKAREDAEKKLEDANLQLRRDHEALAVAQADKTSSEVRQKAAQEALETLRGQLEATATPLRALAFSSDGRRLAAVDEKGVIHIIGAGKGTPVSSIESGSASLLHVAFTPDQGVLVVDANGSAGEWDAETPWKLLGRIGSSAAESSAAESSAAGSSADSAATPPPFTGRVTALAFNPDGSLLATGDGEPSRSGHLKVWKISGRSLLWAVDDAHSDTLSDIQFSHDGKYIATAGTDKFVRLFAVEDGKLVRSLEGHTGHVLGVGWQADGRTLASCGADGVVKIWDVEKGEQRQTIGGYGKQVTAVSFVGIGGETISCSGDRTVRRHQAADKRQIRTFDGASEFVHCLSITPDGGIVAVGDENGVVRIWNASDGRQLLVLEPPKAE